VAENGLARLDEGENPNLPFGKIIDPKLAFQTTLSMLALWVIIKENEETKLWPVYPPECVDEHIIVLHGNPTEPVRDILTEVLALAKRIKEKGEISCGEHVVKLDITDITLRVKIFRTTIDITAKSDIDELVTKHDAQPSNPIPVFGSERLDGVVGMEPVVIW
jgi:hypothetical protein